jgi:exosortase/archaeosortase family protein
MDHGVTAKRFGFRGDGRHFAARSWLLLVLQIAGFWPVWQWYPSRMWESADERWGLLALVTIVLMFSYDRFEPGRGSGSLTWSVHCTLFYAVTYHFVPMPIQAGLAATGVALTASALRFATPLHLPTWGLILLSLPIMPSLQFYFGYPMRVISGTIAALLLQLGGLPVMREGTCLRWGSELVSIDAPCSGVKMLWAGLYLTCVLAWAFGLSAGRAAIALTGALVGVMLANAIRSAALFHLEVGTIPLPASLHGPAGIIAFAAAALGIVVLASGLRRRSSCAQ